MATFAPGETVKLKSGGPGMVIKEVRSDGEIICQWSDHKGQMKEQSFPAVVLISYEPGAVNFLVT